MNRIRVLITDGLDIEGIEQLTRASGFEVIARKSTSRSELLGLLPGVHALVVRTETKVDASVLEAATDLRLVVRAGAGVDNIDVVRAQEKGVTVQNTAGANAVSAAEHTFGLLLNLLRNVTPAVESVRQGEWNRAPFFGNELRGKKLGVVGVGHVGREVVRRALAFDMDVLGFDIAFNQVSEIPFSTKLDLTRFSLKPNLPALLSEIDILTLHVPKTSLTTGMIGADALKKMKRGSWLVNCARGGIVDETALRSSLDSGHLRGAALDVVEPEPPTPDHPLLKHPRVLVTPHLGGSTDEARRNVALQAASQVVEFFTSKEQGNRR